MEHFILNNVWFILCYIIKPFGIYPCKRSDHDELQPTSMCRYWSQYLVTLFGILVLFFALHIYSINFDWNIVVFQLYTSQSYTDYVLYLTLFLHFIAHIYCIFKLRYLAKELSIIQNDSRQQNVKLKSPQMLFIYVALIIWLIELTGAIQIVIGRNFEKLEPNDDISMTVIFVKVFIETILFLFLTMPVTYFTFIYIQLLTLLLSWKKSIQFQLENSRATINQIMSYIRILNEIGRILSPFVFIIVFFNFITAIVLGYYVFSLIGFGLKLNNWMKILIFIGFSMMLLSNLISQFVYCTLSEKLMNEVQYLKISIKEKIQDNNTSNQIDYIYSLLENFKGFNGNGFFILNHSLLTGMASNITTFLVILIQFRQYES